MIDRIKKLEKSARLLEPTKEERSRIRDVVINYTEEFLEQIGNINAFNKHNRSSHEWLQTPLSEEGGDIHAIVKMIKDQVDTPGLNPASGGHLGYIPGGGIYYSALGDYMADISNRYAGVYFAGPGAVMMENRLIEWMAEIAGYPKESGGNLTSGGSIANLIAIATAREAKGIKAAKIEKTVVYLSEQAHHSIGKALRIAGLGESILRYIPVDEEHKMLASSLEQQVIKDKKAGLEPFMLIAAAGTTDVGAIDPLKALGMIAQQYNLWYHIDGAYGAFFVLTEEGKIKLQGMELSDSLVLDPHKGLFLPYGSGAVLIKNKEAMHRAHFYEANYMQDAQSEEVLSPAELSPELTRHFRGMRMWLPLKLTGIAPFRACLQEKLLLARYFHQKIQELPGFEAGPEPELSVVTFRYIPEEGKADNFNRELIKAVHEDGRVFLSSTLLNGRFILRLAILAFRTHLQTVDLALEVLEKCAGQIKSSKKFKP